MKLDILGFGAHPDDIELCTGGTLIRHVEQGYKVGVVDLTRGQLGTRGTPELRMRESKKAANLLGLTTRENLGFEDGFFPNDRSHQLEVIRMLRLYRPEVVIANSPDDRHPDHGRAAALVREACFKSGLARIETTYENKSQKLWRPRLLLYYIQFYYHKPDLLVDISPYIDRKMKALKAYSSQFHDPRSREPETFLSRPEFFDEVNARARELGQRIGVDYAEGFVSAQAFGVPDLVKLQAFQ